MVISPVLAFTVIWILTINLLMSRKFAASSFTCWPFSLGPRENFPHKTTGRVALQRIPRTSEH